MKRLLSLVLSLVLLVSLASMSFAAVTVGGNLRVWYQSYKNEANTTNEEITGFTFDRLALTFASELSAVDGFKGEIQFRQPRNDTSTGSTYAAPKYGVDIRIDNAYYYQKAALLPADEFDIGYIKAVPFNNGAYNVITLDTIANSLDKNTNSVGVKYADTIGALDFALALVSANNQYAYSNDGGMDYGLRVNYAVLPSLKLGAGYLYDKGLTGKKATTDDSYTTSSVIDVTYNIGPFGTFIEYVSSKSTTNSVDGKTLKGIYGEVNYKIANPLTVYVAHEISMSDEKDGNLVTSYVTYTDAANNKDSSLDNWTTVGAKYMMAPNTYLQGEFVSINGSQTKQIAAIRCQVNF